MKGHIVLIVLAIALVGASAQDPIAMLPGAYTLEFENEWVKVTRVHYAPHVKLPAHAHTALASAYVYLSDSGPVAFKHIGADYGAVTRAPTRQGSFRLYRGVQEIHEVENLSPLPSDFLRIEFKTDPVDARTLRGKFLPLPIVDEVVQKIQFENAQMRVTRLVASPGRTTEIIGSAYPSLLVSLSPNDMGDVRWLSTGQTESLAGTSTGRRELLRFELLTPAPK